MNIQNTFIHGFRYRQTKQHSETVFSYIPHIRGMWNITSDTRQLLPVSVIKNKAFPIFPATTSEALLNYSGGIHANLSDVFFCQMHSFPATQLSLLLNQSWKANSISAGYLFVCHKKSKF